MRSPFKFLDAYQKDDRDIYFGRTLETDEIYDRIYETNLILLYGASGTGKTSLINCGLANRYETTDWHPIFIRRRDNFLSSITHVLDKEAKTPFKAGVTTSEKIRSLYLDFFKPIYLIFDQFEEVFIMGTRDEQDAFFMLIHELLESNLQCKIIISMREEYIANLSDFERIVPTLFENRLRIERMSRRNLGEVIEGTAKSFNIELVQPEKTIDLILKNLTNDKQEGVELANLQVYIDKLYRLDVTQNGGDKRKFTPELVASAGRLDDVLAGFLDEQLAQIEEELAEKKLANKGTALDVLFALVTDSGTKQSMETAQIKSILLQSKKVSAEAVDYCIQRFQEMRIVREMA